MDKNFCAAVILYHPTARELNNVLEYAAIFPRVLVYDNTEGGISDAAKQKITAAKEITLVASGSNNGLSVAYNVLCKKAIAEGSYTHIVLYDQDSVPNKENIIRLENYILSDSRTNIAVYGPRVIEPSIEKIMPLAKDEQDADFLISSGSFIDLKIYQETDGFDENLFIDMIDYDYCYTVRAKGYRIIQYNKSIMHHAIGGYKQHGKRLVRQHSPLRKYYIIRNTLYFRRKQGIKKNELWYLIDRVRHTLRYDDNKLNKIKMMIKGYLDYRQNKMGKYGE